MTPEEIAANTFITASILLAGRNSIHTWWTGIIGCALFGFVYYDKRLYAMSALQLFFIGASIAGWCRWRRRIDRPVLPIRRTPARVLVRLAAVALVMTAAYSYVLWRFTDAAAPVPDSVILAFSILAQFLLLDRRIENWWCWLIVNTVAVPLCISQDLGPTAALSVVYWFNAVFALVTWRRKLEMTKPFRRGLVVGKFCPLHLGHESVIRCAIEKCVEVLVLSYSNPEFPGCEPERRRQWLSTRFPGVRSLVLDNSSGLEIPPNDAPETVHRRFTGYICREHLGGTVDAVFTSEGYGDGFAAELTEYFREAAPSHAAVAHVLVDAERKRWPVSGTLLRSDIHAHRDLIAPEVYASFVRRVALLGGESSGKTVLAEALANEFGTVWVPEYGRELWEAKGGKLTPEDLPSISRTQIERESAALLSAKENLFCDTSPLTTLFYSLDLFGDAGPALVADAERHYDHLVLCAPDFPFFQDGTRRDAAFRQRQHDWYLAELKQRGLRFHLATGPLEERVRSVSEYLRSFS